MDFFIVLDVEQFRSNPVSSLLELSKTVKNKNLLKCIQLMEKYKKELIWEVEDSNAYINLIEIAQNRINKQKY